MNTEFYIKVVEKLENKSVWGCVKTKEIETAEGTEFAERADYIDSFLCALRELELNVSP